MQVPDWRSFPGGTVKRVALWLLAEVGEGGVFSKEQLRVAFPGVAQVDRRARDLRDEGWVIHTNREDISLDPGEQRLVAIGGRVWEAGYQRKADRGPSNKQRAAILSGDDYCCVLCGVSGGESYPDEPIRRAKLLIARLDESVHATLGESRDMVTVCDRCHAGGPEFIQMDVLKAWIGALSEEERAELSRWVGLGRRPLSKQDKAWSAYRRLPATHRAVLKEWLLP